MPQKNKQTPILIRSQKGAGLVEAVAGLVLLTTASTLGLLLLINSGVAIPGVNHENLYLNSISA